MMSSDDQKPNKNINQTIINKLNYAEGLRLAKKYEDAARAFDPLPTDYHYHMTPNQKRWCYAHHGAAALSAFVPYKDKEEWLDKAEQCLRKAVDPGNPSEDTKEYPWAWSLLGEVYRQKGNLAPFCFVWSRKESRYQLRFHNCVHDYKNSLSCFEKVLDKSHNDAWANAHYAASFLNSRRRIAIFTDADFPHLPRCYEKFLAQLKGEIEKRLTHAAKTRDYWYPWGVFYIGVNRFLMGIFDLITSINKLTPKEPTQEYEDHIEQISNLIDSIFYMAISLLQAPSPVYENALQPGTVSLDPWMGLAHDFFDFLPVYLQIKTQKKQSKLQSDSTSKAIALYLKKIDDALKNGEPFFVPDQTLVLSGKIRLYYARDFANYMQSTIGMQAIRPHDKPFQKPFQGIGSAARKMLDTWQSEDNDTALLNRKSLGNGFLSRVFDVISILVKSAVIWRIKFVSDHKEYEKDRDDKGLIGLLAEFIGKLGILKNNKCQEAAECAVTKLYDDVYSKENYFRLEPSMAWLLQPVWALDQNRVDYLKTWVEKWGNGLL